VALLSRTISHAPTTINHTGTRMNPKNPSGVRSDAPMTIVIPQQHERDEEQETRQDSSERQKKWSGCGLEVVAYCGNRPSMLTARAR